MALPNANTLRRLTTEAWARRSRDSKRLEVLVNSLKFRVLRRAEEAARMGFKKAALLGAMTVCNADDAETLTRVIDELQKIEMGFEASWDWSSTKGNEVDIRVAWVAER